MKDELRAIGILQKKETNSETVFEVLTVVHKNDYHKIKHINHIYIDIANAQIFKYQAEIRNISKINMHYKISFVILNQNHQHLKPGMECMVSFNYDDEYIPEHKKETTFNNRLEK